MAVPTPQAVGGAGLLAMAAADPAISRVSPLLSGLLFQLIHASFAQPGLGAAVVSILIMIANTFLPIPGESVGVANGAIFGFWGGLAVSWIGVMSSAVLAFGIGRALRRPMATRGYIRRLLTHTDALIERGSQAALVLRFIPLRPFTVFNIALGRARIGWWTFLWTTALGILPAAASLVAIGYGATAVHSMFLWGASALAGLITAGLACVGWPPDDRLCCERLGTHRMPRGNGDKASPPSSVPLSGHATILLDVGSSRIGSSSVWPGPAPRAQGRRPQVGAETSRPVSEVRLHALAQPRGSSAPTARSTPTTAGGYHTDIYANEIYQMNLGFAWSPGAGWPGEARQLSKRARR